MKAIFLLEEGEQWLYPLHPSHYIISSICGKVAVFTPTLQT